MTNKKPYLVKLKGKGLADTGLSDAMARKVYSAGKGRHYLAIVEVVTDELHDKLSDQQVADLSVTQFWFADDTNLASHLRDITDVLHQNRGLSEAKDGGQDAIEFPTDGKLSTVIEQGAQHRPHPYLASTLSTEDEPVCDVCGQVEGAAVHADRAALADPFASSGEDDDEQADDEGPNPDDPAYDDHEFIDDGNGTCVECNQTDDAAVHTDSLVTT